MKTVNAPVGDIQVVAPETELEREILYDLAAHCVAQSVYSAGNNGLVELRLPLEVDSPAAAMDHFEVCLGMRWVGDERDHLDVSTSVGRYDLYLYWSKPSRTFAALVPKGKPPTGFDNH